MSRLLVLSAVLAFTLAAPAPSSEQVCSSWDNEFEDSLLKPLRSQLKKSGGYTKFADFALPLPLVEAKWKNGRVGNFSSLELRQVSGIKSQLCTEGNYRQLKLNLGFDQLEVAFDAFSLGWSFFSVGGGPASLSFVDETISVSMSTMTDPDSQKCTANVDRIKIDDWGHLKLDLDGGIINYFFSMIFNNFIAPRIFGVLETFGLKPLVETQVTQALQTAVNGQAEQFVCALVAGKVV